MGPILERFAQEYDGQYVVGKVNVDENEQLAMQYKIMSIPAIKVFRNGQVVASSVGVKTREQLLDMILK